MDPREHQTSSQQTRDDAAKTLNVNRVWLPASPHLEGVVRLVTDGDARIEPRGSVLCPLLVLANGESMELRRARVGDADRRSKPAAEEDQIGDELHPDVCDCVDEVKKMADGLAAGGRADLGRVDDLLGDTGYMISRMEKRLAEYQDFFRQLAALGGDFVQGGAPADLAEPTRALREILENGLSGETDLAEAQGLAEQIRAVATGYEEDLKKRAEAAVQVGDLYRQIKGARMWGSRKIRALSNKREIDCLFQLGRRQRSALLDTVVYFRPDGEPARSLLVVSKRVDKRAVVRNRIKRYLREAWRREVSSIGEGADVAFVVHPRGAQATYRQIADVVCRHLRKALAVE